MELASLPLILFFLAANFLIIFFALQLMDKKGNSSGGDSGGDSSSHSGISHH